MAFELVLRNMLLLWLIKASLAQGPSLVMPGCQQTCGSLTIPYPFGIGPNCSGHDSYTITCNTSFSPPTPFINSINMEVLNISLDGTIRVNNPMITSNCSNRNDSQDVSLLGSDFSFSSTNNRFTAMGCDSLALISRQSTAIGGCIALCSNNTLEDNTCYGIRCCQTRIPPSLKFINATMRSIDPNNDRGGCRQAFMVDLDWFSNLTTPFDVQTMETVPAVLDWRPTGTCTVFGPITSTTNRSVSLCTRNAFCTNQTLCSCRNGYEGNPYLPDGCQGKVLCCCNTAAANR